MKTIALYCLLIIAGVWAVSLAKPGLHEFQSTRGVAASRLQQLADIGGAR